MEQPTGTVTFLFSDIEGSTKLLQALGSTRYAEQLDRHRAIMRKQFEAYAGYEVGTEGDSFFVAFGSANDAAHAASVAQQELHAVDWPDGCALRVRIGIHTGEPVIVESAYIGVDVHKAARIMSAGHGGQVLLSEATRRLLEARFEVSDLGEQRLKDLLAPERLYQLAIAGVPDTFPRLRTLEGRKTNLPAPVSDFIGREAELDAVGALLREERRLVTLTGVGGAGKSRIALSVAAILVDDFAGGVFYVQLSSLRDETLVLAEIAKALEVEQDPQRPLLSTLGDAIGDRKLLLLLDNADRVRAAAPELARLLETCPHLSAMVTSRVSLGLAGETVYQVPPLASSEALDLLISRAQSNGVHLERADPALVMLVERVERLPLALELAAARLQLLSPAELASKVENAIFESGRLEHAPTRQQTIRSMIDWSYDLMTEPEQTLFARLSIFVAHAPLEALEKICGTDLETLSGLVRAGFVRVLEAPDGDQAGFVLPAMVRSYARQRLTLSGEEQAIAAAHAEYYLGVAERLRAAGPERAKSEHEQRNYWAALDWAKAHDAGLAAALGRVLGDLFRLQGRVQEGHSVIAALDHRVTRPVDAPAPPRPRQAQEPRRATTVATDGEAAAELERGRALLSSGALEEAGSHLGRALSRARDAGDDELTLSAAVCLAYADLHRQQQSRALRSLLIALRLIESTGSSRLSGACFEGFAAIATASGEFAHAARMQGAAESFGGDAEGDELAARARADTETALTAALGEDAYRNHRTAGAALSVAAASAEARAGTFTGG